MTITGVPEVPGTDADGITKAVRVVELLALEAIEVDIFRGGAIPGQPARLYGGQVAAQALAAAGHTAGEARPHSLHAYFLRPGDSSRPVLYRVDRLQDGRTFLRRRVTAIQQGEPILCLESSFTTDSSVASDHRPAPPAPPPDECPVVPPRRVEGSYSPWHLLEVRAASPGVDLPRQTAGDIWFRFRAQPLPGTRSEVMITYLSDLTLAATALRPTPRHPAGRRDVTGMTSLDHSVWFHNEPDLSGWLLYAKETPVLGGLRGLVGGAIFGQDGALIASVAQEALMHVRKDLGRRGSSLFDTTGTVRFRAVYTQGGQRGVLEETSRFVREGKRWLYVGPVD